MSMEKDFDSLIEGAKEKVTCKLCGKKRINVGFKVCEECADRNIKKNEGDKP